MLGFASAHLVLAVEEAAKSMMLYGLAAKGKLGISWKSFRSHDLKLKFAKLREALEPVVKTMRVERLGFPEIYEPPPPDHEAIKWMDTANELKQKGLYIDLGEGNEWLTPSDVTEQDYQTALRVAEQFVRRAEYLASYP